jgi:hypothetical protein
MNDEYYNTTIEKDGRTYRYDPDYDCYYRVFIRAEYDTLSHGEKYGWIYVCIVCLAIAVVGTYVQA